MEYLQYDSTIFNIPLEIKTNDIINSQYMILPSSIDNTGSKNVTSAILASMNKAISSNKILYIPKGIYLVKDLKLPSNLKLHCCEGSIFKLIKNAGTWIRCINIANANNITITGRISIDGNAKNQLYKNEHMHCMFLYNCHNINIESINAYNAVGDNVSISGGGDSEGDQGYSSEININYINATTAGRKNLVLEHVTNCIINTAICDNTYGNTKGTGGHSLDVEPFDYNGSKLCNNTIKYLKTTGTGNDFTSGINYTARNYTVNISVFDATILALNTTYDDGNNHEYLSAIYSYGISLNIDNMRVSLPNKKHPSFVSWDKIANYPNVIDCEFSSSIKINSLVVKGGVPNSYIFQCMKNSWNGATSKPSIIINSANCDMNYTKFAILNDVENFIVDYLHPVNIIQPYLVPFYSTLGNAKINNIS